MKLISKFKQLFCIHDYEYIASRQKRQQLYQDALSSIYGDNSAQGVILEVDLKCSKCSKEKTEKEVF